MHLLLSFIWIILKIVAVLVPVMIIMAFMTLAERKVISYIQVRIGPNRVGFRGLAQPMADVIKLITKEILVPAQSNKYLFLGTITDCTRINPYISSEGWISSLG